MSYLSLTIINANWLILFLVWNGPKSYFSAKIVNQIDCHFGNIQMHPNLHLHLHIVFVVKMESQYVMSGWRLPAFLQASYNEEWNSRSDTHEVGVGSCSTKDWGELKLV